jgi:hypothetical protein
VNLSKVLIKIPSRGRPERLIKALDSIFMNVADVDNILVSCTLDEDDETVNNESFRQKIAEYKNTTIEWGLSNSKIHAVNRSVPESGWDIIVIGSDDIYFNLYGFDQHIRSEMFRHFPDGDGYLHFKEKDSGEVLNVMTVIDRKYYDRFNYIYHPDYVSLFADNEQFEVAKMLGRYVYLSYEIMEHRNPAYGYKGMEKDELFIRQQELGWTVDQEMYHKRRALNFGI